MKFILTATGSKRLLEQYPQLKKYNLEQLYDVREYGEWYHMTIQNLEELINLMDSVGEELIICRDNSKNHNGELVLEIYNAYRE